MIPICIPQCNTLYENPNKKAREKLLQNSDLLNKMKNSYNAFLISFVLCFPIFYFIQWIKNKFLDVT